MEENLDKLERQQQDALERWRIRSERAGLALDKLEGQISVIDDPIGDTLETIRRQEDAFEVHSCIFLCPISVEGNSNHVSFVIHESRACFDFSKRHLTL